MLALAIPPSAHWSFTLNPFLCRRLLARKAAMLTSTAVSTLEQLNIRARRYQLSAIVV
jgi:hypothetical protein